MTEKNTNWLASAFVYLHDIIDSADRPISKLVMVLLPFIAPLLPALITAKSLQTYMQLPSEWTWIGVVAFEMIGYLGMITVVGSIMNYIKDEKNSRSWSAVVTSGTAYGTYLFALIAANLFLELANKVPTVNVTVTACLTVGLSVSASLLNGQRIYDRNQKDEHEKSTMSAQQREDQLRKENEEANARIRRENNEFKLKKKALEKGFVPVEMQQEYALTGQSVQTAQNTHKQLQGEISTDWRKVKLTLQPDEIIEISQLTRSGQNGTSTYKKWADRYETTEKTMENWKINAQYELMSRFINSNKRFPSVDELGTLNISSSSVAKFILKNEKKLVESGYIDQSIVENARNKTGV